MLVMISNMAIRVVTQDINRAAVTQDISRAAVIPATIRPELEGLTCGCQQNTMH